jgi:hypothetical protein
MAAAQTAVTQAALVIDGGDGKEAASSFQLVTGPRLAENAQRREIEFFAPDRPGLVAVLILERRDE